MKAEVLAKEIEKSNQELLDALALMQQQMMMLPKINQTRNSNVIQTRFRVLSMKFEQYNQLLLEYTGYLRKGTKRVGRQ